MAIGILTHGFASSVVGPISGAWDGISKHSVICFETKLITLTATVNPNQVNLLLDLMTTTFWTTPPGNVVISSVLPSQLISYIGLGPGNWASAGASIQVYITDLLDNRILVGESSSQPDFKPLIFTFDQVAVNLIEIVITNINELSMTVLTAGTRIDLPKTPDIGFMPGFLNNLDEETDAFTEGNAFGVSRVMARGWEENAPFSDLEMTFIREEIPALIAHKGKPLFFAWNIEEFPLEIIFGRFQLAAITYNNVLHGGINLTINGVL